LLLNNNLRNLKINRTPKTPQVDFNHTSGVFLISGISVPENSIAFYEALINWLGEYKETPADNTKLVFKLTYVNTSSLQFIYELLKMLESINDKTSKVSIEWYYLDEDIDMKEMGEDFKEAIDLNFSFFEVETVD